MPFLLFVILLGVLIGVYYYNNNRNKHSLPRQPVDDKLTSLLALKDEPTVLAALLCLASLSYKDSDNELGNMIESDILAQLTDKANARSSLVVAENLYFKLNDRLFIIDEAAPLLNKQISAKDCHHLFVLINEVNKKIENENGISFYIKRLEKKLILNNPNAAS
ncbi:hypothetical protein N5853_06565 [Bartonella sp. HY329]|uniref:hypothetical protein n=1 Tax=unclassified Bartonella TaxID=2645622 RepID=UPI0021C99BA4|nr:MULTISPECIES: hypothetical protein [unclassified Bartonella]UXM96266.1 hypothetical protein N5853_06565 [Bartonella sp. HY329]UXN10590.1 hypothetical protein N5852_06575 [Bartonella sp. HY328]